MKPDDGVLRLVEVIAHELRSPLGTIALWVDVLRTATTDEIRNRALEAIAGSCAAQYGLVADLLDHTRAIAGRLQIDQRSVAIEPALREVVGAATETASKFGVVIDAAIARELGEVHGDELRLRRAYDIVLAAAIERSRPNERVRISARRTDHVVEFRVQDAGPLPTPERLVTMFDPLHRENSGTTSLRLALARRLVQLHGGSLVAEALDGELTLTLTVPAAVTTIA